MKILDAENQFEELVRATQVFLEEEFIGEYSLKDLKTGYIACIEPILLSKALFKQFMEYLEMMPADFFMVVLMATGCEIKEITKKMSRELRQTLKEGKMR